MHDHEREGKYKEAVMTHFKHSSNIRIWNFPKTIAQRYRLINFLYVLLVHF